VILLEWLDPPFTSGHWNPELIDLAGGREVLARPGERSRRCDWAEIARGAPEVIIVAPCGFPLDRTARELPALVARAEWRTLPAVRAGRVMLADGNSYFSRPGPRLLESLAIAAHAVDPERRPPPLERAAVGWRWL
jgi:iron complex transport system substrate-binding protein